MPFACIHIKTIQGAFSLLVYESFKPLDDQGLVPTWCSNHFDIDPTIFDGYTFWRRQSGKGVWITAPGFEEVRHESIAALGMLVMRQLPPKGKPTSVFLQRFGQSASRNVYQIDEVDVISFLERKPLEIAPIDDRRGYALVRTRDRIIGCARVKDGRLVSEIPKHWLAELGG